MWSGEKGPQILVGFNIILKRDEKNNKRKSKKMGKPRRGK
jgi:hypothetical protein